MKTDLFDKVEGAIQSAHLVAYDGCHKIYLAMDEVEATWFRDNYEFVVEGEPEMMFQTVVDWFEDSCSLRFVSAVRHTEPNPNDGYESLICQFEDGEDEEE